MRVAIILCAFAALSFSTKSCARTPLACNVSIGSDDRGYIKVTKDDPVPDGQLNIPLGIGWSPPNSTKGLDFGISYSGSSLEHLNDPSGGHILISLNGPASNYKVNISTEDGDGWSFGPKDVLGVNLLNGEIFTFSTGDLRGRKILRAIHDGKHLKIDVVSSNKVEASSVFDTSNVKMRDALLADAAKMITDRDPSVCKPLESMAHTYPRTN